MLFEVPKISGICYGGKQEVNTEGFSEEVTWGGALEDTEWLGLEGVLSSPESCTINHCDVL